LRDEDIRVHSGRADGENFVRVWLPEDVADRTVE
jgi:hypothetical protein